MHACPTTVRESGTVPMHPQKCRGESFSILLNPPTRSGSKMLLERVHQHPGPVTYHIGGRQARLILSLLQNIPGLLIAQSKGHNRETHNLAWALRPHPAYSILIDSNHTLQRRQGTVRVALDSGFARLVTKYHSVGHRTMYQAERHRRVTRMIESPLSLDKHPVVFISKIEHHLFNHTCHKIANNAIYP